MYRSGKFQKYDYGSKELNQQHYHQDTPPVYEAKNIRAPITLFYGEDDWLADVKVNLQLDFYF